MRYLEAEAATEFGVPLDDFRRRSLNARAEMVAHVIARNLRQAWLDYHRREHTRSSSASGYNPLEAQRRKWKLEPQ